MAGATPRRDRLLVNLSRAQLECGAGAWPAKEASRWLPTARLCSGRVAGLLVDDELWSIEYLLVHSPAHGGRQLLVPLDWVGSLDCAQRTLSVSRTCRELASSPSY